MIKIKEKQNCCGCEACAQICPKQCIQMQFDNQGFRYPAVNVSLCIDCGLCESVCPVTHQSEARRPLMVYGAINKDDYIRIDSSSGGIFTALAETVISRNGEIWGARFNEDNEVVHDCIANLQQLSLLRGSKYVQSSIGLSYKKIKMSLKAGKDVLFSGTPCQVAGLRKYLGKDYPTLYTVDIVCHGVPSPGVWKKYLEQQLGKGTRLKDIKFRDKTYGWEKYCFSLKQYFPKRKNSVNHIIERRYENLYMRAFLHDLILRPSCYNCPARSFKSGSDLTLADLWGAWVTLPEYNDDKGCSCVAVNTEKGKLLFDQSADFISFKEISYKSAFVDYNCAATTNPPINPNTDSFFFQYESVPLKILIPQLTKDSWKQVLKERLRISLEYIGLLKALHRLKRIH